MTYKPGDPVWVTITASDYEAEIDCPTPGIYAAVIDGPASRAYPHFWHVSSADWRHGALAHEDVIRPRRPPDDKREPLGEWANVPFAKQIRASRKGKIVSPPLSVAVFERFDLSKWGK